MVIVLVVEIAVVTGWDLQRDNLQWSKAFTQNLFTTACNLFFMLTFLFILIICQISHFPCMHYSRSVVHKITNFLSFIICLANIGVSLWTIFKGRFNDETEDLYEMEVEKSYHYMR